MIHLLWCGGEGMLYEKAQVSGMTERRKHMTERRKALSLRLARRVEAA